MLRLETPAFARLLTIEAELAAGRGPSSEEPRPARRSNDEAPGASDLNAPALYRLMAWLSPSYPVGAFSYSSGIEWAVEAGDIKDADALSAGSPS